MGFNNFIFKYFINAKNTRPRLLQVKKCVRPPSYPPFSVFGVPLGHIEFLDTQNLYVDTKIMILARILKQISEILSVAILSAILCN